MHQQLAQLQYEVVTLRAELKAEREKVKELEAKLWIAQKLAVAPEPGGVMAADPALLRLDTLNEELRLARQANEYQHQQLAAAQATIEQMREALGKAIDATPSEYPLCDELIKAANLPTNLDALHEARAQECERLAAQYYLRECKDWLLEEAAAHRAKKGQS